MLIAVYCTLEAYANEDKGFSFPAAKPEQVGMNQAKLEQAKRYAQSAGGSGMIVRQSRVVLRWGDQKKRYDIKSATKSFGATTRSTSDRQYIGVSRVTIFFLPYLSARIPTGRAKKTHGAQ